jgi:hypothetical protein
VQGRPFKVAGGDVKPAIVLLRHNENNYSISIALVGDARACEPFSFTYAYATSVGAGLPAMRVNHAAFLQAERGAFKSIAGKPAPTEVGVNR